MVGQQADLPLPLLLLDSQLGPTVPVRTAAAEQDEDGPQQPEPWTQQNHRSNWTLCCSYQQKEEQRLQ